MLALLLCEDRECRATFEADGSPEALKKIACLDCGGPLRPLGYADAEPRHTTHGDKPDVRRAA